MLNNYTDLGLSESEVKLVKEYDLTHLLDKIHIQQEQLEEQNQRLENALGKIETDLNAAREAQMKLLPRELVGVPQINFKARFFPSQYVSGDIYNVFRLDEHNIGVYHIDISGHGVPAALFSVSLSQILNTNISSRNLLKIPVKQPPYYKINPPDAVVSMLNEDHSFEQYGIYFTMIYMIINIRDNTLRFVRAGHNHPIIVSRNGKVRMPREGGLPVGWDFPRKDITVTLDIQKGDRVYLYSDGISEAMNQREELFGTDRLQRVLLEHRSQPLDKTLNQVLTAVKDHAASDAFEDDVSIIGLELL